MLYACSCKCACMAYFGNGIFCTERGFLSFRTGIPDGPEICLGTSVDLIISGKIRILFMIISQIFTERKPK